MNIIITFLVFLIFISFCIGMFVGCNIGWKWGFECRERIDNKILEENGINAREDMLYYKNFYTIITKENDRYHGKIECINDYVDFIADTREGIEEEFHNAVDEYIEFCNEVGKPVEVCKYHFYN